MHHYSWKFNESVQGKEEINWITVRDEKAIVMESHFEG